MQSQDLTDKTNKIMDHYPFIKAIMVADKEDGVQVFENKRIDEKSVINDSAGGISAIRLALVELIMCNNILTKESKSIVIHYDKLPQKQQSSSKKSKNSKSLIRGAVTVYKKIIHKNLILIIIWETKGMDISVLYDVGDEIEQNFEEISKVVDEINANE